MAHIPGYESAMFAPPSVSNAAYSIRVSSLTSARWWLTTVTGSGVSVPELRGAASSPPPSGKAARPLTLG